jgi:hypothetical protein
MNLINRILDAVEPEVLVEEPPLGFFKVRIGGSDRPDCLGHSDLAFGVRYPVTSSHTIGGKTFTRERDEGGRLVQLKVWVRPVLQGDAYVRGDKRFADTTRLETFTGEFEYAPTT